MQFYNEKEQSELGKIQNVQSEKESTRTFKATKSCTQGHLKKIKEVPDAR